MKKYYVIFFMMVILLCVSFGTHLVMANDDEFQNGYRRYFREITIQPGDSLWSIAQTYNQNSNMEIREYISELKRMNGMHSDEIRAGDSLTIVYFSQELPND